MQGDGAGAGHREDGMKYLILIDKKPAGLQDFDGDPHLFYAGPLWPAHIFDSYDEARNMMRRVRRWRKRNNLSTDEYSVQSVESGAKP